MKPDDWEQVRSIYLEGINTGNSTFECEVPEWKEWDRAHLPAHRLVVREDNQVIAWAALTPVSTRAVYSGLGELSLYVAAGHRGEKVGSALLEAVIVSTEKGGLWTLQGNKQNDLRAACRDLARRDSC